ncbi:MAG TPA: ComEC/Rec2 family competence protein, partial [Candidatus Gracilibacteria bacterium]|nr:ComEC/Rec2 family competence protein [Candidatus Gracilibacteria bacterium]
MPRSCVVKSVCISFFVIVAIFTMSHVEPVFPRTDVAFYRGLDLVVTGVVDSEVTVRSNSQRFYFVAESVQVQAVQKNLTALQSALLARAVAGKIAVDGPLYPARAFGEKLELHGMLESPPADSPTYVRYLQKEGIYATIKPRTVRSLGDSFRPELRSLLMRFRSYLQIRVDGLFTDPVSGIVLGLLLGIRSTLPPGILADFQTAGLTHILAISGYNITLLITICAGLLRQRSRRVRFGVTIFTILCFAI